MDQIRKYIIFALYIHRIIFESSCIHFNRSTGKYFNYSVFQTIIWRENDDKVIIPDVSIICNLRDRKNISFTGIPRFVMEVLSNATEEYDRHEKMDIYCKVGVSEYWIVDWRKKSVEIYLFDFKEDGTGYPYLYKTVTAQNKEDLHLVMFPNLKITFDELFDIGEY